MEVYLRKLTTKDVCKQYLKWMNDIKITQFTEQRFKKKKLSDLKEFIIQKSKSKNEYLFGIFVKKKDLHVGNIKLGPINFNHKTAYISYFIGDRSFQNYGIATKVIKLICKYAKKKKLRKLKAACYSINEPSIVVLKKNGFKLEAVFKNELLIKNKKYNQSILTKFL